MSTAEIILSEILEEINKSSLDEQQEKIQDEVLTVYNTTNCQKLKMIAWDRQ